MMRMFPVRRVFGSIQELYMDSFDGLEQSIAVVDRLTSPQEATYLVLFAKKAATYTVSYCVDKRLARWGLKCVRELFRDVNMEYDAEEV
jgi:hypothetical protein